MEISSSLPTHLFFFFPCFLAYPHRDDSSRKRREGRGVLPAPSSPPLEDSAQNRCTSLACSCYAPAPGRRQRSNGGGKAESRDGPVNIGHSQGTPLQSAPAATGVPAPASFTRSQRLRRVLTDGPRLLPPPLKSSLRKKKEVGGQSVRNGRKVGWPDNHGKDLAHVQEFHSSDPEGGDLEGVREACNCVIL